MMCVRDGGGGSLGEREKSYGFIKCMHVLYVILNPISC